MSIVILISTWIPTSKGQYAVGQRVWSLPTFGNYFSVQLGGTNFPPAPFFPYDPGIVPVYSLNGSNSFIYDDGDIQSFLMTSEPPPAPGEGAGNDDTNSIAPAYSNYTSNDLWLEINITNNPATFAFLTLHGTRSNLLYQLFSSVDLGSPRWAPGEIIQNTNGINLMLFSPVSADAPARFFKVAGGQVFASIDRVQDAIEPAVTNAAGQLGIFEITLSEVLADDLNVNYTISGTASNDVDYTNLTGTVVIPANSGIGLIIVQPRFDDLIEFDESVLISLAPRSGYVVDTNHAKASIFIEDNLGTNTIFETVATNVSGATGIAYHPLTNALIVSGPSFFTQNFNFVRVGTNTAAGFFTNWSSVHDLGGIEIKLAIVSLGTGVFTNSSGFTNGAMFFGTSELGVIGVISPEGSVSNLNWLRLPVGFFRGGFHIDTSGSFDGDLIAATSSSGAGGETVWQIKADRTTNVLATIDTPHLEGVITLTNDAKVWGPWAGKVITGNEDETKIFAIGTNGSVETFLIDIHPEDFDVVPKDQDLYCAEQQRGLVLRVPHRFLTGYVGSLAITQAGENVAPAIFLVRWDGTDFVQTRIKGRDADGQNFHLEHATFAPIRLSTINN